MTGGGFGGCTVNMVRPEDALPFQAAISHAYQARFNLTPDIYPAGHPPERARSPAVDWSRSLTLAAREPKT